MIMNRPVPLRFFAAAVASLLMLAGCRSGSPDEQPSPPVQQRVANAVVLEARPVPLQNVQLLDGPFRDAMDRDVAYLMRLDPDRFLHYFRTLAGLDARAPLYGGWESMQIAGHSLGHYLTALSYYYAQSGNAEVGDRIEYIVSELAAAQDARGSGYVAGIPDADSLWTQIQTGNVDGRPFNLNGVWVPWYTLHKLFAGLVDAYRYGGSEQALAVVSALADWAYATTSGLDHDQWQEMLKAEHGGMNEALADLYALTGDRRYLELSRKFHHDAVLNPLAQRVPALEGLHANTQIPKVIGLARQYQLTGNDSLLTAASFFWNEMISGHTYVIGGNSEGEHLGTPGKQSDRLGTSTAETCNTYNMLRLTKYLFEVSADPRYADYYEQALFNHIFGSQDPETGMFTYFVSLKPGHFKTYSTPDSSFWCCVGSGMENHVRYTEGIYFTNDSDVFVNLPIASELLWAEKGIRLRQETRFPDENRVTFSVAVDNPVEAGVKVRVPSWVDAQPNESLIATLNGQPVDVAEVEGYATIRREWQDGDRLVIEYPMRLRVQAMPDNDRRIAILYGPIVLAGALGTDDMPPEGDIAQDQRKYLDYPDPSVPTLDAEPADIASWLKPVAGEPLTFRTDGVGRPNDVTLIPFYRVHHQRYTVYWDLAPAKRR